MNREPFNDGTSHPPSGGEAVARNAGAAGVRARDSCGHWMCSNLSQQFIQKCILSIYDMYWIYIYIYLFLLLYILYFIYYYFFICIKKTIPVSTTRVVKFLGSQETVKAYIPTSLGTALAQGPWLVNFMYWKLVHVQWEILHLRWSVFSCFQGIRFNLVDRLIFMDESYPWLFNQDVTRWMVGQVGWWDCYVWLERNARNLRGLWINHVWFLQGENGSAGVMATPGLKFLVVYFGSGHLF